ncbi:hypothetical protein GCM10022224_104500 [Nonomuraea antimicrobica]|uniref:Uncharacterized protein n=1 Tax=Nonomuraea antimicrobica TaxID=561173 RepID=A0ABP7ERH0_9ACTN
MNTAITLDMAIPHPIVKRTLAEAVESLKREGWTGLLADTPEDVSEHELTFRRAVRDGRTPTIGEVLAAYYVAAMEELDKAYYEDNEITNGQYRYRKSVVRRLVFRRAV